MTRADKAWMAGGLLMALVGLAAAAALVWLAIDAAPGPSAPPPFPEVSR